MSLLTKLQQLKINSSTTISIAMNKTQLIELFGEDYEENRIVLNRRKYCYIFEEEKQLYYVILEKHHEPILYILCNPNNQLAYTKMDDVFLSILIRVRDNYANERSNNSCQEQVQRIEHVLNHPSLRLLHLFIKDRKYKRK